MSFVEEVTKKTVERCTEHSASLTFCWRIQAHVWCDCLARWMGPYCWGPYNKLRVKIIATILWEATFQTGSWCDRGQPGGLQKTDRVLNPERLRAVYKVKRDQASREGEEKKKIRLTLHLSDWLGELSAAAVTGSVTRSHPTQDPTKREGGVSVCEGHRRTFSHNDPCERSRPVIKNDSFCQSTTFFSDCPRRKSLIPVEWVSEVKDWQSYQIHCSWD